MNQIHAAVSGLHDAGIIWGDVKAENVLIDQDSNAWVTDFGGGYTKGWVDKEMAETMERDRMGMAKLREFVFPAASKKCGAVVQILIRFQGLQRDVRRAGNFNAPTKRLTRHLYPYRHSQGSRTIPQPRMIINSFFST